MTDLSMPPIRVRQIVNPKWQAACPCGWVGHKKEFRSDALRQGARHQRTHSHPTDRITTEHTDRSADA